MKNLNENNKWALITGASGGVGKEIAKILAKKGWNLVLVARSESKLVDLSKELVESNSINVKTFSIDLASENASVKVFDFCKENSIVVDLLINNAGCGLFGSSVELGEKVLPMLNLNIIALTQMCAIFGKQMQENKSGSILNIGSIAGNQPTPMFASYAASKSYVLNYSLALRHELSKYGVNVTCVQPGYIRTEFDANCGIQSEKYKKFSYNNGMTAEAVAKVAVKSVLKKRSYVRAGFTNKIVAFFSGLIPKNFLAWTLSKSISSLTK
ncbi:MAG: SDR family oxidoreductase [Treponemataceae bacterium]|nr:SDR family oxidoreductase [Treponemataceae bacterium]